MRSRVWFLVLGAAFALAGCDSSSGTTTIAGGTDFFGDFPGTQISNNLVSDDGRAFNHSGAKITKGIQVFWNCSNGAAVVLYVDGWERLWAHYWNGTTFTPGVELRGPNQHDLTQNEEDDSDDDFETFEIFRVLFLNTTVQGRNGDALILWTREDDPVPGSTTDTEENNRLYGTYFDVSESGNATSAGDATVHYGFESMGTTIDFNNSHDNVNTFGFVSDSLKFTHAFDEREENSSEWPNRFDEGSEDALTPATRSGDPTSFVWIVWRKDLRDFAGVGVNDRYHALQFDLTQVGNAIPAQTSLGQGVIPPVAGATIDDAEQVDDDIVVHNGCLIWRVFTTTGVQGVFLTCFDATGNLGTIELSQSVLDTPLAGGTSWARTDPDMPLAGSVYGGDHGLTSLYAFFFVFASASPSRIAAAKVDLDATFGQAAREIEQISPDTNFIQKFDGGKDGFAPETRINRTSSWIFVTWLQGTGLPAQLAGFSPGSRQVHMHGVQTRASATARTLANSLPTGGPFRAPNQVLAVSNPSGRLFIQDEIANGMEDPLCGIQSNLNRINLVWHEGLFPLIDLKHNGLTITLATSATTPPTAVPSVATGGLITQTNDNWSFDSTVQTVVTDLGNAAGDPLVYYMNNENNPTDPAAPGAFEEFRVFGLACTSAATPADAELVSTDGPLADQTANDSINDDDAIDDYYEVGGHFLHVKTTPSSRTAGAHGGTRVHVFWRELRHGENSKAAFRTRSFDKPGFAGGATFSAAHMPTLAAAPTSLGGTNHDEEFIPPTVQPDGDEKGPFTPFCTATGNTVGIYFTTTAHFWYQEFNGSSWLGAPEIIDNEAPTSIFFGRDQRAYVFPPMLANTCDNLSGTLLFYSKFAGDDVGRRREWVRVHD